MSRPADQDLLRGFRLGILAGPSDEFAVDEGHPGRFFPEAWARFRDFAGLTDSYRLPTDSTPPISGLLEASSQMMEDPDIGVRSRAAAEWMAWGDAVISQEGNGSPGAYGDRPDDAKLARKHPRCAVTDSLTCTVAISDETGQILLIQPLVNS